MDRAIIYYTSNRESPGFEQRKVDDLLLKCGDIPIISVSQKPINLGKNICVGDVGASNFNMFRQIQIACQATEAEFVISAEADCLYPPDYFTFTPPDERCYRNSNLYVMGYRKDYFYKKEEGATHAQIINRKVYLKMLEEVFKDLPQWNREEKNFPKERTRKADIFDEIAYWETENPVVQIKTKNSMRFHTHSDRTPIYNLPYWGDSKDFRKKYYV